MSVSDSVSEFATQTPKKTKQSSYGDGVIWSEISTKGTQVWKVEITIGRSEDGRVRKTRRTVSSKAEAIRVRRELNSLKIQGLLEKKVSVRFSDFAQHWLADIKPHQIRETTIADYKFRVAKYLNPFFGNLDLDALTPTHIHRWTGKLAVSGLSTNTINGARRILFGIMRHAQRQGLISTNPVSATDALKQRHGEPTQVRAHWDLDESRQVLSAANGDEGLDLFLHLAIYLGLRHGEILGLKWEDLDIQNGSLSVNRTLREYQAETNGKSQVRMVLNPPKTESSRRTLHMPEAVLRSLARHSAYQAKRMELAGLDWRDSGMIFTTSVGTPISQTNNLKRYRTFLKVNSLRYIRIHDIRHSSAVLGLEAGASIESISQALGHSGIEITKTVYAPYVQALNDRFTKELGDYLEQ